MYVFIYICVFLVNIARNVRAHTDLGVIFHRKYAQNVCSRICVAAIFITLFLINVLFY